MNNKNVYSLNNTFEGKVWVDWKGKDGKMGQEISWREKPNISTLRKSPRIGTCVHVRGVLNGTGTRVHSCKILRPCAMSQISGCGRPQIIHTSMQMAAFSGTCMSTRVCVFEGIVYVDWKHRIGLDIGRCSKKTSAIVSAGKTDIGWSLVKITFLMSPSEMGKGQLLIYCREPCFNAVHVCVHCIRVTIMYMYILSIEECK